MCKFLIAFLLVFPCAAFSQVILNTGRPEFSIPIHSFNDTKSGLSLNTELVYDAGNGIKVSELASSVGLGWNLSCGGMITRKQNDVPDDQHRTNGAQYYPYMNYYGVVLEERWLEKNIYGDGYLYNTYSNAPLDVAYSPQWDSRGAFYKPGMDALADREQDEFTFSFDGEAGSFIIGKNGQVISLKDSKLIIEPLYEAIPEQNVRTTISGFKITAENGTIYSFKKYELDEVCAYDEYDRKCTRYDGTLDASCGTFVRFTLSKIKAYPLGQFVISKWFLTEIENPITHEKIVFNYTAENLDYIDNILLSGKESTDKFTILKTEQRAISKGYKLQTVLFPDSHKLEFGYDTSDRADLAGGRALASIKEYYANTLLYDYRLTHGYYYKTEIKAADFAFTEDDKKHTRLCLTKVQKYTPVTSEPPYIFSYYMDPTINMAPRLSNYRSKDYWGYFNYNYATTNGNFNEEATNNLLGWEDVLKTEDLRFSTTDFSKLGMLKQVQYPLGGTLEYEYEYNSCNNTSQGGTVIGAGGVRVSKTKSRPDPSASPIIKEYKYVKSDGITSSAWGYETPLFSRQLTTRQYKSPYNLFAGKNLNDVAVAAVESMHLRIENVPRPFGTGHYIKNKFQDIAMGIALDYLLYVFQDDYKEFTVTEYELYPYDIRNSLPFQYSRVEVNDMKGTVNLGKTIYEYRSKDDVALLVPSYSYPHSSRQRFLRWQYGLPVKTTYKDNTNRTIKEVVNTYTDVNVSLSGSNFYNIKSAPLVLYSAENSGFNYTGIWPGHVASDAYYFTHGRTMLESTIERNYSPAGGMIETTTQFTYNGDYELRSAKTTNSNGDISEAITYYPGDYNSISTAIGVLKNKNMLSIPVSTEKWIYKNITPAPEKALVSATINEYGVIANGEPQIINVHRFEASSPVGVSVIGEQGPGTLVRNTNYFKNTITNEFDNDGNLFKITTPGGRSQSFIYDYNKRLNVATITNDNEGKSAYSSFESDGNGYWQFDTLAIFNGESVTGYRCFRLYHPVTGVSYPVTRTTLNAANTYTITFWAKLGSTVVVNGLTPDIIYQNSEWQLCRKNISGATTVTISGTGLIDELRLFPASAHMKTVTYDPAAKVPVATCDENNVITYFEYDSFGRMIIQRDADKNVIKTWEYNTKQ